ncbi:Oidioi.mRNA.OKI2018_I69.PAR.g9887.t1.cds [Oikopleura dioica]|uniref:Oidioi.mRNA.OKI2018_I69.PAR.g9887.t1.cds n=1 Tax=Oikopleura dioica TaxID=34765 RepID=A0ABN7RRD9_OIKDI|nr:Oidioi.mRNA.OKI2018_I69.PAR.g9887.t1.cds [Oikopleura dioica]
MNRFGRKNSLLVWHVVTMVLLFIHSLMPDKWGFLILRTLNNGTHHTSWLAFVAYSLEVLGPTKRSVAGATSHVYYAMGYIMFSGFGYFFPDWRGLTFAVAMAHLIFLVVTPFFPESPSFLYSRKLDEEARKVLTEFSEKTNKSLDDEFLNHLEEEIRKVEEKKGEEEAEVKKFTILDLLKHKEMRKVALIMGFGFISTVLSYYGLSFNVSSISGNLYLNNTINGIMELLGYSLVTFALDIVGRKWCSGGLMLFGGIVSVGCAILAEVGEDEAVRWLSFVGKFAVSGAFCAIYVYAGELYPTEVRSTGIGFASMTGRIGGFVSPFIIQIESQLVIYLIFGIFGIVGGALMFLLPEVKGRPILQTIEEAVEFYKNPNKIQAAQEVVDDNEGLERIEDPTTEASF